MSTKTHDDLIKQATRWAKSLGYEVASKIWEPKLEPMPFFKTILGMK